MKLFPIAGGSGEGDGHEIDPADVVAAVDAVDEAGKPKPPAKEPVKQPAREIAAAAEDKADASLRLAWSLAEDHVKDACPDVDAETLDILKRASGNDPVMFKNEAKKMQAKMAALKTPPKDPNDPTALAEKLTKEIFSGGGPGGDPNRGGPEKPKKPEERVKEAVEKGDSAGLARATVDVINTGKDGKPLFDGVRISLE